MDFIVEICSVCIAIKAVSKNFRHMFIYLQYVPAAPLFPQKQISAYRFQYTVSGIRAGAGLGAASYRVTLAEMIVSSDGQFCDAFTVF